MPAGVRRNLSGSFCLDWMRTKSYSRNARESGAFDMPTNRSGLKPRKYCTNTRSSIWSVCRLTILLAYYRSGTARLSRTFETWNYASLTMTGHDARPKVGGSMALYRALGSPKAMVILQEVDYIEAVDPDYRMKYALVCCTSSHAVVDRAL
jgi:hypothetical protein